MNTTTLSDLKQALTATNDRILIIKQSLIESETASVDISKNIRRIKGTQSTRYLQHEAFVWSFESNY